MNRHRPPLDILIRNLGRDTIDGWVRTHLIELLCDGFVFVLDLIHTFVLQKSLLVPKEGVHVTLAASIKSLLTFSSVGFECAVGNFGFLLLVLSMLSIFLTDALEDLLAH